MVYYLHGKTLEEIPSTVLPETLYPDLHDLRNYAVTYVYPNGEVEQVLRTVNLRFHVQAIQELHQKSKYLPLFISKKDSREREHYASDEKLVKENILIIYYVPSYSDLNLEEQYGLFYLPEKLTANQETFLSAEMNYIAAFPDLVIGQYNSSTNNVESICEFDKEEGLKILKEFVLKEENTQTRYSK